MTATRIFILFVFSCLTALSPAFAATWEGVFEGTIGTSRVIVELHAGEGKTEYSGGYREGARYSYAPKLRDINLVLDAEGETLRFTETLQPHRMFADETDKKITGHWTLNVDENGAAGVWSSPKRDKTLPIALKRVTLLPASDVSSDTDALSATYEGLWVASVNFVDDGLAKKFGPIEVRYVKDSAFHVRYPVIGAFPDAAKKANINAMLMQQHKRSTIENHDCFNGVPVDWASAETEMSLNYDVTFASETLMSFVVSGSVFCGGAHPNNFVSPQSFDLVALEPVGHGYDMDLQPEGFGRMFKLANKSERIAFESFALAKWRSAAEKDKEMGKDCMEGWVDEAAVGEKVFSLSLTTKGLAITRTDYPHAASVCLFTDFNPTVIPFADLKAFLKPGQSLLSPELFQ